MAKAKVCANVRARVRAGVVSEDTTKGGGEGEVREKLSVGWTATLIVGFKHACMRAQAVQEWIGWHRPKQGQVRKSGARERASLVLSIAHDGVGSGSGSGSGQGSRSGSRSGQGSGRVRFAGAHRSHNLP